MDDFEVQEVAVEARAAAFDRDLKHEHDFGEGPSAVRDQAGVVTNEEVTSRTT